MKSNKSKYIFVAVFIAAVILIFFFMKNKSTSNISSNESQKADSQVSVVSKDEDSKDKVNIQEATGSKGSSDLRAFEEAYKSSDVRDSLYAGKDAGFEKFFSYDKPLFVNFTWISCEPCKEMAPYIENIYNKHKDGAVIKDVEVTINEEFAREAGIRVTPTQVFIPNDDNFQFSDKAKSVMDDYFSEINIGNKKGYIHEGLLHENELDILVSEMING